MAIHEFGHVFGSWATGGNVKKVVLHPFTISRTDVDPNPKPSIVVWMGPILGSLIPMVFWAFRTDKVSGCSKCPQVFCRFCLIANGAYIAFGSLDQVGDCEVMMQLGSPIWLLFVFGLLTMPCGLLVWHGLGSVKQFWADPNLIEPKMTIALWIVLASLLTLEFAFSPM